MKLLVIFLHFKTEIILIQIQMDGVKFMQTRIRNLN